MIEVKLPNVCFKLANSLKKTSQCLNTTFLMILKSLGANYTYHADSQKNLCNSHKSRLKYEGSENTTSFLQLL